MLGLLLLVTLGLLWREKRQKQGLRKDVQTWEEKFRESVHTKSVELGVNEHQSPHQLLDWNPNELGGQSHLPQQLEGWRAGEMEGTQVTEAANRTG